MARRGSIFPAAVALDSTGNLYVADTLNNLIRKMTLAGTNWVVTTLPVTARIYGSADGTDGMRGS